MLEYLAACTCVKTKPLKSCTEYRELEGSNSLDCNTPGCPYTKMEGLRIHMDNLNLHDDVKESGEFSSSNDSLNNMNDLRNSHHKSNKQNSTCTVKTTSLSSSSAASNGKVQDEILRSLRYLMSKQEQEEQNMKIVNEWRQIATVLDRALFWVFLVGTLVSSISFLVIVPMERRGFYG